MRALKKVFSVGFLTLISRLFGYVRDLFLAFFLGAGVFNDVFVIALRIPNMFRSIFGEGAFSAAFIPIFSKKVKKDGIEEAFRFASVVQTYLVFSLVFLCLAFIIFMPNVISLIAPGYSADKEISELIIALSRISFSYIIFISLMAFYGGMCNSLGNYAAFASAPILLNIVLIVAVMFGSTPTEKIYSLTIGTVLAGILEMLWVLYFLSKFHKIPKFAKPNASDDIKKLFKNIIPGIFGSGIIQINIFIGTIIASFHTGGVSYLYYADRVYQLPLAIIGTALGTVLLPEISKCLVKDKNSQANYLQNRAIDVSMLLTIPAALALSVLSLETTSLLFERGEFNAQNSKETAAALSIFALALPAYVFNKIFTSAFYAKGDTSTPVKIAFFTLLLNIAVSLSTYTFLKHTSVALGSLISSVFNSICLYFLLKKKGSFKFFKPISKNLIKYFISALIMAFVVFWINFNLKSHSANIILKFLILILSGFSVYFLSLKLLKVKVKKSFR